MIGASFREFDLIRIKPHDGKMPDQIGVPFHQRAVHLDLLLAVPRQCRFESEGLVLSVPTFDTDVGKILLELDEFPVPTGPEGAPQSQVGKGLEEVGLPLSIPSQQDINPGRNVHRDLA